METEHSNPAAPLQPAKRFTRRKFFTQFLPMATLPIAGAFYVRQVEPFWVRYHDVPITIKSLPTSFDGFRIAQVTDMHTGRVPFEYLQKTIASAAALKPDAVVFTGDLVHHNPRQLDNVVQLIKAFSVPVLVSFGNHDYGNYRGDDEPFDEKLDDKLDAALTRAGAIVLRNKAQPITHADGQLWFAGLDDLWFGDFQPKQAFKEIPEHQPVIALSHNPDTAEMLADYHPDLILCGHTHGGQLRLPFYGAMRLNVAKPQYDWGHFQLPNSQLYVSSGVGYIRRMRFNCRPEVPFFQLVCG